MNVNISKVWKIISVIVFFFSVYFLCWLFEEPRESITLKGQHYIAHAGGMIDGYRYTNCLEAVDNALSNGIDFIELDFSFTSDSILVCVHDWSSYKKMIGYESISKDPISYEEFISSKIYGYLTPLSANMVDSVLLAHPEMYLVTDKISDFSVVNTYFGHYKNRLVVECFEDQDYKNYINNQYFLPIRNGYPDSFLRIKRRVRSKIFHDCLDFGFYAMSKDSYETFAHYPKAALALFSCKDREEADSLFFTNSQIQLIYIDDIGK